MAQNNKAVQTPKVNPTGSFSMRMGSTTYIIGVHFSAESKDTLEDKMKRLMQYAAAYPDLCKQTDDDEQGGLTFEIDRRRFAVRLTAPYSDEHRKVASELAKRNGLKGRV